jgi:hypothetical protein
MNRFEYARRVEKYKLHEVDAQVRQEHSLEEQAELFAHSARSDSERSGTDRSTENTAGVLRLFDGLQLLMLVCSFSLGSK